ncbi:MAG TPA: hypothetical protein DDX26_00740, partial [Candidatus Yonathbacteria bacterium]|nr:hypothetical protein [Candidatus Yonathbacteria bacterium]
KRYIVRHYIYFYSPIKQAVGRASGFIYSPLKNIQSHAFLKKYPGVFCQGIYNVIHPLSATTSVLLLPLDD